MTDMEQRKTEMQDPVGASEVDAQADVTVLNQAEPTPTEGVSEVDAQADASVARLEAEKADLTDRLVRLAADMDNLRKRSEREIADARRYAVSRFAADMLTVGDNLRRALEAVPAEARTGDSAVAALVEGVEMTAREMERVLERHGVTPIAAEGERFDPHRHQAVYEVPDESVPAGTVVQVAQPGYMIGERVLRAAMVGVSRGGPKPAEAAGAAGGSESSGDA